MYAHYIEFLQIASATTRNITSKTKLKQRLGLSYLFKICFLKLMYFLFSHPIQNRKTSAKAALTHTIKVS